jgi:hypothetical protein
MEPGIPALATHWLHFAFSAAEIALFTRPEITAISVLFVETVPERVPREEGLTPLVDQFTVNAFAFAANNTKDKSDNNFILILPIEFPIMTVLKPPFGDPDPD